MKAQDFSIPQMERITQHSNISKALPWTSELPGLMINGSLILGNPGQWAVNYSGSGGNWIPLIASYLPHLCFAEFCNFFKFRNEMSWLSLADLAEKYHWIPSQQFFSICEVTLATPLQFQTWLSEKKIHPQDLLPLLSIADKKEFAKLFEFLNQIAKHNASKSIGIKILELLVELLLLGLQEEELAILGTPEQWQQKLSDLRYPISAKTFSEDKLFWQQLSWPRGTQIRFVRQADRTGIELKCFISNSADVKKYSQSLMQIENIFADRNKNL